MNKRERSWDLSRVSLFLDQETIRCIISLPIGISSLPDRWIWPWTSNGEYSVKFGYHITHSMANSRIVGPPQTSHVVSTQVWKGLWKLKSLPKIKFFCWRILSNAIATKLNLFKRKISQSSMCPVCENNEESVEHLFLLCPWTAAVWFGSPLNYRVHNQSITTFDNWLNSMFQLNLTSSSDRNQLMTIISFILWEIWKARCKFVIEGRQLHPIHVLDQAMRAANEFIEANVSQSTHSDFVSLISTRAWTPPSDGFVKVNTDAAWIKESNRSGVGVVIRDSAGNVCGGLADNLYCCSALHAEAEAALRGLSLAKRKGFSKVMLETDSTILKQSVEGKTNNGAWSILPTILEIRRLANRFQSVEWSWIPRSINKAAHVAASIGIRALAQICWAERPPPSLQGVLEADGLPGPPN
ncbi:hypothetical protein ACE6H2_016314 [Prunus campanulata]